METAFRARTVILAGRRIEIAAPHLPEGTQVEVLVTTSPAPLRRHASALEFLNTLPAGPRAFGTWEEYQRHLEAERYAWEP